MADWKGVILAGGTGSRLFPLTRAVNKHLLPVYDKPMLYYPITTLMFAGVRDYVIVTNAESVAQIEACLGTGERWGVRFSYVVQPRPAGIADGLLVSRDHIAGMNVILILGDNVFYGDGLISEMRQLATETRGAAIFAYPTFNPSAFGIVELDRHGRPVSLEEKPAKPRSNLAVPGLYFYDSNILEIIGGLAPSSRGEIEITDANRVYLDRGLLRVRVLGRGVAWLDGGTPEDLYEASQFVQVVERRTGLKIGCPEEVAYRMGFIGLDALAGLAPEHSQTPYDNYIRMIVQQERHKQSPSVAADIASSNPR
jgi:glucose-1-phosphate thymidylyltransferase